MAVWPGFDANPLFARMIAALAEAEGIDLDTPFDELDGRHRRIILHGAGETWYAVPPDLAAAQPGFSFQYKGLFPAIEEAGAGLVRLPLQAPRDGRRRPLRRLHGRPAARRRGGRPVPRLSRSTRSAAGRWARP